MNLNHHSSIKPSAELILDGNCGYQIRNGRMIIDIGQISNCREADNLSGSLAVEAWALKQPYHGGGFTGFVLAGTTIGELQGQHYLQDCRYDLIFREPPPGTWIFALMLREWNGIEYITRDYVNFELPWVTARVPALVQAISDNVITVNFVSKEESSPRAADTSPLPTPALAVAEPVQSTRRGKAESITLVSVNGASKQELAAVKGLSNKLAAAIVAKRPYAALEQLLEVRGMGSKLFEKVRALLTI